MASELCVNSFRAFAPKNESKLGLRVATRLTRNSCLNPSVVMMALIYLKRLQKQGKCDFQGEKYSKKIQTQLTFNMLPPLTCLSFRQWSLQSFCSMMELVSTTFWRSNFTYFSDDECYNDDWACGVGMELEKLNKLEISFLNALR